ncbi:MAG: hypothetical protein MJB12_04940 [Firmicutes bacterium]|nr:hypothetical protein [Bacillota bacterium]
MKQADVKYDELLRCKLTCIEQMHEATVRQRGAIESGNENLLVTLIEQKNQLIGKIEKINRMMKQFNTHTHGADDKIKTMEQHMALKIKEIYEIDQQNLVNAKHLKKEMEKSMQHMHQGKKALTNGYFKHQTQANGYFIDKKIGK